jgi:hypothetical protein
VLLQGYQIIQESPVIDALLSHGLLMSGIQDAFECPPSTPLPKSSCAHGYRLWDTIISMVDFQTASLTEWF